MATRYQDWASNGPVPLDADFIDLDDLPVTTRRSFGFAAMRYDFANSDDLSLTDQENLRRLYVRLWEIEHGEGDDDGMLTPADAEAAARMDRRICEIAIYGATGDVTAMPAGERAELVERMNPRQRNVIRNAFFKGFDGMPYATRVAELWWQEQMERVAAAKARAEAVTTESDSETSTASSETPSTAPSTKPKKSRRPSAAATRAA